MYLASPLGFSEAGRHFYTTILVPHVRALGYEVLDPWTLTDARKIRAAQSMAYGPAKREAWRTLNLEMGATNRAAIDAAQAVVAVLDGTDVDSGTAAEIGYAAALSRPVVGLRSDLRISGDNEATLVNLQVEWFVVESGGQLATSLDDALVTLRAVVGGRG